jgi:hypothetical protein
MYQSTESSQLFRSTVTYQVVNLGVTPDNPPQYLFLSDVCTLKTLADCNWEPIDSSDYLGIPSPSRLGEIYFDKHVKKCRCAETVSAFIKDFLDYPDPIDDAIISILDGMQSRGEEIPYKFTESMKAFCEANS